MQREPDTPREEANDDLDLTEPEIEQEVANSDEWMQKGFRDSDPPEEERLEEDD